MIFELSRLFLKDGKKRLRPSDQSPAKGALAFFNKPSTGLLFWVLVWLAAFLLQMIPIVHETGADAGIALHGIGAGGSVRLLPGCVSPVTIVAAMDFNYLDKSRLERDKQSPRAYLQHVAAKNQTRPNLVMVFAGTVLVERGQKVDADTIQKIRVYQARISDNDPFSSRVLKLAGDGVLLLLGLVVTAILFRFVKSWSVSRNSMILLLLLVSLLSLAPIKWLLWIDFDRVPWLAVSLEPLLPLALAPLLMAILINPAAAMVLAFWVSLVATVMADYRISVFVMGMIMSAVVIRFTRSIRTRSALFRIGLWAGLAGAICTVGFNAVGIPGYDHLFQQCAASMAGGVLSALLAMLLLPLLEIVFGISTDISLLELSDLEHPLLKRLAIEAPGTYHHSLMVANLTQAAVAAIGGNALRAGICSYFHDIGKLVKPSFFSENIQYGENPHDDLSPSMSTLVIISHVKEGVNLALRHKLPRPVVDAIQQHHGSGLVYYFYHKASVQSQKDQPDISSAGVKEEDFRYPGPRPQTREIAVLSMADAIEAASRSLEKISPGNLEDLVRDVVDSKIRDGQMDLCDLTLAEINTIRRVLIFTLSNMLHGRIAYPSDENNRPQSANETPSERP